jgi:phosphohistidine phosphatase
MTANSTALLAGGAPIKTLLLMRHAKSDRSDGSLTDHDRPLNQRGKRDAPRMGALLREKHLVPDAIVSSTARRARQTAELLAGTCGYTGEIDSTASLYLAGADAYRQVLHDLPGEPARVLIVAHNPGTEEFLGELIGTASTMPTAAIAHVSLPIERWSDVGVDTRGRLVNLWLPREIG